MKHEENDTQTFVVCEGFETFSHFFLSSSLLFFFSSAKFGDFLHLGLRGYRKLIPNDHRDCLHGCLKDVWKNMR